MRHDAAYFRKVAAQCRLLSEEARDRPTAKMLVQMAEDFEEEARLIDVEERQGS
jgi:Flp pilus assembly CpaE family ATPase